jgi:hypothetical protein
MIFSTYVGNPDSGIELIPNSDRLPEKIAHMGSTQHHHKIKFKCKNINLKKECEAGHAYHLNYTIKS